MSVEPIDMYEAYCDVELSADDEHDEGLCEWSWVCDRYGDSGDCEIELIVHMKLEHDIERQLPFGYEYRQKDLDKRFEEAYSNEGIYQRRYP